MKHGKSVAIVGVGGLFPKSPTLKHFWSNITGGVDTSSLPPRGRWLLEPEDVFDPAVGAPDKIYSQKGCFIDDEAAQSVPEGLDISPEFLGELDPMFALLLRAGSQAFYDGITADLDRSRTGLIIGNLALPSEKSSAMAREYLGRTFEEKLLGPDSGSGTKPINHLNRYVAGLPAGILAKSLSLGGTCYTLDAACASSIYGIKLAADELLTGRADAMLAGGLSRPDSLYTQMGFSQLRALSRSGRCSPFDAKGDGLVVGEGCGMFLLKRTEDALRDGDNIYAVIRGIGLSNDLGGSLLAPDSEGQLRAMRSAYQQAGWSPSDVDMIECHATGTPVGDAVEFSSLKTLWGDEGWRPGQCVIGSVKSNIGHLLTAAGSAALIKTLLALKDKTLPPTANYLNPAKGVDIDASPFRILDKPTEWKPGEKGGPRRAAISAFGFGGINAHLLIEEWLPKKSTQSSVAYHPTFAQKNQPVAIVGMDAHFGEWDSLDAFRQRVLGSAKGENGEVQPGLPTNWYGSESSRWFKDSALAEMKFKGFFVPEVSSVPGAFRIPPKELEEMLPRQLLMLKVAGEAINDAGLKGKDLLFTGVFIGTGLDLGATNFSYRWSIQKAALDWAEKLGLKLSDKELKEWIASLRDSFGPALTANRTMGALGSIVASRIAKEFHIGGPSFTLSSEDNSGLRALEVGIRALQEGSINRAIVGAADMAGDIRAVLAQHEARPYSKSGLPRPFDKDSDGALIGEGAAALVLKRLEDARQDGDRIYAVINGIGTATGGSAEESSPCKKVYAKALERTFASGDIAVDSVSYLETNGSGYQAEDEMEANVLGSFFAAKNNENPCYIGSVKADIGHSGEAAGIASIVKTALCLSEQILPPIRNLKTLRYEWVRSRRAFLSPASPQFWMRNRGEGPRRALVSSFGIDGSCSHALLEGFEGQLKTASVPKTSQPLGSLKVGLFPLEADSSAELLLQIDKLESLIVKDTAKGIDALAASWLKESSVGQSKELFAAKKIALAAVADSKDELLDQLAFASNSIKESPGKAIGLDGSISIPSQFRDRIFYNPEPLGSKGKIAFVFPGSGNHFAGMGRELSARWPEIYRSQDGKSEYLAGQFLPQHFWQKSLAESIHDDHNRLVIGQVALGTAISDLARSFGLKPQAVIGYSLGETAGLFSFAAWRDRDGMSKRLGDSTLFTEELAGECRSVAKTWGLKPGEKVDWVMGIVDTPAGDVKHALKGKNRAYLLIINTHRECIVGGDRMQVEALVEELGCHFIVLRGVTTVHCEVARSVSKPYRDLHVFETTPPKGIDFYSSALGRRYELTSESAADVILGQALETVDYTRVIEQAYDDGVRVFLEMGPGNSCSRMISSILEGRPHMTRAACFPGQDATSLFLRFLARCSAEGIPLDLGKLYPENMMHSSKEEASQRIFTTIGGKPFDLPLPLQPKEEQTEIESPIAAGNHAANFKKIYAEAGAAQTVPASDGEASFVSEFEEASRLKLEAHEAYLRFSEATTNAMLESASLQMSILQKMVDAGEEIPAELLQGISGIAQATTDAPAARQASREIAFDRDMCMEFAIGSIAKMLGPEFAEVDTYPTRVRLPDEPLMLVDRIISVEGEPRSMTSGRVVTEHDVTADRWYLDGGRIPTCIAVEAGQADLFLSGYLGIDFIGKGKAVYRLLDAVVTFHRGLPVVGEVIHYDIKIERFFKQDKTYLFNFSFEGTVNGEPLLSMQKGCAGFFTEEELAAGKGIVHTRLDLMEQPGKLPGDWRELLPMAVESYDERQVDALYAGDLKSCFGPAFDMPELARPYTLPGGLLKLVDRVVKIDPNAGRYGLGQIVAEMDIDPKDWFLVCHFVDDRVMPGTLMYECCMHTLRIYLLRMGWLGREGETWCEPVPGVDSGLKCRGQVTEETRKVTYQVSIKELGYMPEPFAIVDALMFADGKAIVEIPNMSVRLSGLDRNKVESLWNGVAKPVVPAETGPKKALYNYEQILAFAVGKPSEAFGEPYKIFDEGRKIARLPGPPFQFIDRVTYIEGEPWKLVEGAVVEAEYDVPEDAWYFGANRQKDMPFSVLLETGLQPCGWLAGYLGSALTSPIDLSFRNLDGNAVQRRAVTAGSGTLTTRVKITRVSSSGGMIIQSYDFEISDRFGPVYTGDTVFGFFSKESLAQQVGVRDAIPYKPTDDEIARGEEFDYPPDAPYPEDKMRMIDSVSLFVKDGGPEGLGFIRGIKKVDPDEWFFKAHFFEDPVCPGSLGLESFIQLLKVVALRRWATGAATELESIVLGERHKWTYRGQIIPANDMVTVEAVITGFDDERKMVRADGFLSVDGKIIYQMTDFTLRVRTWRKV
ncbi:MAG: beta-ketoacyl synthase N-terminal-like domain-containing protein [bacterium]|nr:beta-ketoacyl synthase N-terminal-like domain-containing protein [bacterium]